MQHKPPKGGQVKYLQGLLEHRNHILHHLESLQEFLGSRSKLQQFRKTTRYQAQNQRWVASYLFSYHQRPTVPLSDKFSPLSFPPFSHSRATFFTLFWRWKHLRQSRGFCAQALHSGLITDGTSSFSMNKSGLLLQSPLGLFKRPLPALRQEFV